MDSRDASASKNHPVAYKAYSFSLSALNLGVHMTNTHCLYSIFWNKAKKDLLTVFPNSTDFHEVPVSFGFKELVREAIVQPIIASTWRPGLWQGYQSFQ